MRRAAWQRWLWALAFVFAYVFLDRASHIDPFHSLNITPWNPAPAFGLLFLLRRGAGGAGTLLAAMLASDLLVRGVIDNPLTTLMLNVALAGGYAAIAAALRRFFPDGGLFADRDGLLSWSAVVIFGALANSLVFVTAHVVGGLLPLAGWGDAVLRFWVGDGVGIFVALPLLWWLQDRHRRLLFRAAILKWETAAYLALTLAVLWIAFDLGAEANFRYFYVLFLPLVWAASRQGLPGAVFCASALQLGMIIAGQMQASPEISVFELQMRALVLALVGFFIGAAVDEQRRAAADLRQSLRLAAAGEMAAALAHELNQPLTALSAYGAACERLLNQGHDEDKLREVLRRMIGEAGRAAEVVRRLRDFFRTGSTHLEQFPLSALIEAAARKFLEKAPARGIEFVVPPSPEAILHADRLQLEVVLRNLLANAFDAVATCPEGARRIGLATEIDAAGRICIRVEDSGPGIAGNTAERLFEPFVSTKSSGLGLGLAISRAIAEAHGGALVAEVGDHGCFKLFLPLDSAKETVHG
ncbi:MAG: hypothetical protein A2045_08090 [Rhodocyclales bacterium GWA2_65_20]|nr:MAG: hypothetical protein A2045_08090 [Rhodocyclales bacterium GWA2_65_20]